MSTTIKNIMVVDDDTIVHYLTDRALSAFSWVNKSDSAYNGKEAIQRLESYCKDILTLPDMILLDLHMPVMNGFEFMEHFNRLECRGTQDIVIAVFTSSKSNAEKAKLLALGVNYIFEKPICIEKLKELL